MKNFLAYIKLWLLFQLFIGINCELNKSTFRPQQRASHTATLIDNKLFILGGAPRESVGNDFFYLDVQISLSIGKPFWVDLSSINVVPAHFGAASVKGGTNNNTLFLYGGINSTETKMELVYTFEPNRGWSVPNIAGVNSLIVKKGYLPGIIDDYGKMYLWGGESMVGAGFVKPVRNDMIILDTINLSWATVNAPLSTMHYAAVLLPDQKIIYLGYYLNEASVYDTIKESWVSQKTSGDFPSFPAARIGFSAVLGLDGQRVIIYGGFDNNENNANDSPYVLNLADFGWYAPKTSGRIPSRRFDHKANVIDKYMVISFGSGYNQSIENDILLLDISNNDEYIWMDDFNFIPPAPPVEVPKNNKKKKSAMIGAIVGSLIGAILLGIGSFILCKWNKNKKKQKKVAPTLGNEEGNDEGNDDKHENLTKPTEESVNQGQEEIPPINLQEVLQAPDNAIIKK